MAVAYGLLYLLFTTITQVFTETYHWEPDICGLAYIGLGIGFFAGLALVARISDTTVVRMTKANDGYVSSLYMALHQKHCSEFSILQFHRDSQY